MKVLLAILSIILAAAVLFCFLTTSSPKYVRLAAVIRDNVSAVNALKANHIAVFSNGRDGTIGISVPAGDAQDARAILDQDWQKLHFFMALSTENGGWKHYWDDHLDPSTYPDPLWDAFTKASNDSVTRHYGAAAQASSSGQTPAGAP